MKKYQTRNGLDVDGWLKPGGPTITKMKEQLGGLLSGYPAPTPEQVDMHHRLRTEGKDGLLNIDPIPIALKPNPNLPKVDSRTHGSNESLVNWMKHHQKGLGGAPDMLATYIKNFGTDGIVQSRDFVEQWERALPGEGATAIRAVLSRLSDPAQQRAFLGGNLPTGTPFGVLKPDAAARIAEMNARPSEDSTIRDMAWRPEKPRWEFDPVTGERIWVDPNQPRPPHLPKPGDEEGKPFWGYDRITGKRIWIDPRQPMSLDAARNGDAVAADEPDEPEFNHGLLASAIEASKKGVQVASNSTVMSDAVPDARSNEPSDRQIAQAPAPAPVPTPPVYQPNAPRPADAADRFPNPAQRARETPEQREIRIDNQRRWASEEADSRGNPSLARRAPEEWDSEPMPKIVNPISGGKVRKPDGQGEGHFGANRGTGRTHMGVDIEAAPGTNVVAPVSGTVEGAPSAVGRYQMIKIRTADGHLVEVLYVSPDSAIANGTRVTAGETSLGTVANLSTTYGSKITNHVHLQVRKDGRLRDPTRYVRGN